MATCSMRTRYATGWPGYERMTGETVTVPWPACCPMLQRTTGLRFSILLLVNVTDAADAVWTLAAVSIAASDAAASKLGAGRGAVTKNSSWRLGRANGRHS